MAPLSDLIGWLHRPVPPCLATGLKILALIAILGLSLKSEASAQTQNAELSAIKVGFVYNFAKFTVWPETAFRSADSDVIFCIRDGAIDGEALAALRGKSVGARPVEVRLFEAVPPPGACHLIYLSAGSPRSEVEWAISLGAREPTLVISDLPNFAEMGGHIALIGHNGRLHFKVNVKAAARGRLELSSRLLQLAEIVDG